MTSMHAVDINRLDLNLLRVFVSLYETRSVTLAAERLGLRQSSMSHSLGRLRTAFGDPLFVRSTVGMQPTPYAQKIAAPILSAFKALDATLAEPDDFDPALSTKVFDLVMTDVCELMFLPALVAFFSKAAPTARLVIHQMSRSNYRSALEDGSVNLALGQLPEGHSGFYQRHLFDETFACAMRPDHPLRENLTLEAFLGAEHAAIGSPATCEVLLKRTLGQRAQERNIRLHVPHYMVVPFVVAQSDLLAVLPRTVSRTYQQEGLLIERPLPFDMQTVVTRQFWHERTHNDPAWKWLRMAIAELFSPRPGVPRDAEHAAVGPSTELLARGRSAMINRDGGEAHA
ncbi:MULTISPECIES: LysR family transcriptional regulator [Neorhizobium]|uniref:LysR family transcriptional regulator n=1 Tax=Neorhizobium TaxID=1525371 RepID=UPI00155EF39E|nr:MULTISPECIES: LysR family transcriptional regulator [Neorhizobium]